MAEQLVPLNDDKSEVAAAVKGLKLVEKNSSLGSDSDLQVHHDGAEDTEDYRIKAFGDGGKQVSLWHDISLFHYDTVAKKKTGALNFVCEIPKFTR